MKDDMGEWLPTGGQVCTSRSDKNKEPSDTGCEKPQGHSEAVSLWAFGSWAER